LPESADAEQPQTVTDYLDQGRADQRAERGANAACQITRFGRYVFAIGGDDVIETGWLGAVTTSLSGENYVSSAPALPSRRVRVGKVRSRSRR